MTTEPRLEVGRDASVVLSSGRVLEYWDGGGPGGRPVIYHPGTPVTRVLGRWAHGAAVDAGARLIALSRPGYGGSTPVPPSYGLRAVGRDTAELAAILELGTFAVTGGSGGGPYAVATAIAAPGAVRAVGLIGAVGPWRELDAPEYAPEDRACLALADAGDLQGTWDCLYRDVERQWKIKSPEHAVDGIVGHVEGSVTEDPAYRAIWIENMQSIQVQSDGYVFDNIAWGGAWDVDPSEVVAPAFLFYGGRDAHCSAEIHGRWYADRLSKVAETVVLPDAAHIEIIDGHWPEVLAGLLRTWS